MSHLIGKDLDAGKNWRQGKKGITEDEMVGRHHWFNGHEFEQAPGDCEGQGSLACCSPWGHKELDMTEWLNNKNEKKKWINFFKRKGILNNEMNTDRTWALLRKNGLLPDTVVPLMALRKSRDTWKNRQIRPWSAEWCRAKAHRVLPREHTGDSKHPLPTIQEKTLHMAITRWSTAKSDIIFFAAKDGEAPYSQQKQDWELTVAQIMNSLSPNSDLSWRQWEKPLDHSGMI